MTRLRRAVRAARAYTAQHRNPGRPNWSAYLHKSKHRPGWGTHSTSQLVAMLAAGRRLQAALEDGPAGRNPSGRQADSAGPLWGSPAAPSRPALPAPQADHPGERGPAPQSGRSVLSRMQHGPAPLAVEISLDPWCTCTPSCWQRPCRARALAALVAAERWPAPALTSPTVLDLVPVEVA